MSDCTSLVCPQPASQPNSSSARSTASTALPESAAPPGPADKRTGGVYVQSCVAEVLEGRASALTVANVPCEKANDVRPLSIARGVRDRAFELLNEQQKVFDEWRGYVVVEGERERTESDGREAQTKRELEHLREICVQGCVDNNKRRKIDDRDRGLMEKQMKELKETVRRQEKALIQQTLRAAQQKARIDALEQGAAVQQGLYNTAEEAPQDLCHGLFAFADLLVAPLFPVAQPSCSITRNGPLVHRYLRRGQ